MCITARGMKMAQDSKAALILNSNHEASAPRPNSLKWFEDYGVWALNLKNAIRKTKKA